MTSNKDLEERIEGVEEKVRKHEWDKAGVLMVLFCVITLSALISIIAISIYHTNFAPQYTPASPCELGLMEWRELVAINLTINCPNNMQRCINSWEDIIEEIGCEWNYYRNECIRKSCPYSGPDIMVVKK